MAEPLVVLRGVTKSYGREVVTEVLHGIDLELHPAEFTALVGPSGCGKTTLLHLLGLLDRPTSGRVFLGGRDTADLSEPERSALRGRALGFVFQFHHLLPAFTALENVLMPMLAARGREEKGMRGKALALLEEIGLADRAHHKATQRSGGQHPQARARSFHRGGRCGEDGKRPREQRQLAGEGPVPRQAHVTPPSGSPARAR